MLPENAVLAVHDILDAIIALGTCSLLFYVSMYHAYIYIYIYGDVIIDQAYNKSFHESLGSLQYHASLVITRAIRVSSKEKL